jgi:hypothetical protein
MLKRKRDLSFAILAASVLTMVAFSQDRILYTTLFASRGAAFPSFNPGATEVVSGFYTLATSEMDGKNMRVIHESKEGHSWSPNWSSDGQWIVFNVGGHFTGPEAPALLI